MANSNEMNSTEVKEAMELLKSKGFNVGILLTAENLNLLNDSDFNNIAGRDYIANQRLHRRWITAQMLRNMGYDKSRNKFTLSCFTTVRNEIRFNPVLSELRYLVKEYKALSKMASRDISAYNERASFITDDVVCSVLDSIIPAIQQYQTIRVHETKRLIENVRCATSVKSKYNALKSLERFASHSIYTRRSKVSDRWLSAYCGEGAYYAMENLVKYSGLKLVNYDTGATLNRDESLAYLKRCKDEACRTKEYYRLVALMKESIEKNGFNHW